MTGRSASPGCVFCDRVQQGEYDTERGSDEVVSFVPLNPVTRMHRLFVPKVHVPDALASPAVTGQVMAVAADYARQAGTPCNLVTSVGREATQSVFHLHVHYVPRFDGDGLHLPWTGQVVREPLPDNDAIFPAGPRHMQAGRECSRCGEPWPCSSASAPSSS